MNRFLQSFSSQWIFSENDFILFLQSVKCLNVCLHQSSSCFSCWTPPFRFPGRNRPSWTPCCGFCQAASCRPALVLIQSGSAAPPRRANGREEVWWGVTWRANVLPTPETRPVLSEPSRFSEPDRRIKTTTALNFSFFFYQRIGCVCKTEQVWTHGHEVLADGSGSGPDWTTVACLSQYQEAQEARIRVQTDMLPLVHPTKTPSRDTCPSRTMFSYSTGRTHTHICILCVC